MQRVLEPELMENMEQAIAYDAADFSATHIERVRLFSDRFKLFQHFNQASFSGKVIDFGTGCGDLLEQFARAMPCASFIGIDGSDAMLTLQKQRLEKAGLEKRVRLVQALIPSGNVPRDHYSVLMSHGFLHHLHNPQGLWQTIKDHANRNSFIFVCDLLRPKSKQQAVRIVERLACNEAPILREDFYNSLCAAFIPDEIAEQIKKAGLQLQVEKAGPIHVLAYGRA